MSPHKSTDLIQWLHEGREPRIVDALFFLLFRLREFTWLCSNFAVCSHAGKQLCEKDVGLTWPSVQKCDFKNLRNLKSEVDSVLPYVLSPEEC